MLSIASCENGGGSGKANAKDSTTAAIPAYDRSLTKGQVTDSVVCKGNNSHSYALYLPSSYSPDKAFPCVYFFDAHARGALPVSKYQQLAERYGFILIGSNVSKNGTSGQGIEDLVKVLMDDTRSRMNIDPKRVYTSGFSGGSRVAGSVALRHGGIAGVIGCSAGFPADATASARFDYFGMGGEYDFNLAEMAQLDGMLQQSGFHHQLLRFAGKHEWAPASDFETAILWMQVSAMKEGLQPKNDTVIIALQNDYEHRIAAATASHDMVKENELLNGLVQALDGLTDVAAWKKQLADLDAGNDLKNAVAADRAMQEQEIRQQQALGQDFAQHNVEWWAAKIKELNQDITNAKTTQESAMRRRLLNYLGFIGYMASSRALGNGDLTSAANFIRIFGMADPQNPDADYLNATLYMKQNNLQQAISSLNSAVSKGYNDVSQLMTDPVFASLKDDAGFNDVIKKASRNIQSK